MPSPTFLPDVTYEVAYGDASRLLVCPLRGTGGVSAVLAGVERLLDRGRSVCGILPSGAVAADLQRIAPAGVRWESFHRLRRAMLDDAVGLLRADTVFWAWPKPHEIRHLLSVMQVLPRVVILCDEGACRLDELREEVRRNSYMTFVHPEPTAR